MGIGLEHEVLEAKERFGVKSIAMAFSYLYRQ